MAKITPKENGPLFAEDVPILKDKQNPEATAQPKMALCRCGQSKNKPFCDGSHTAAGFVSEPPHDDIRNEPKEYRGTIEGKEVVISYTPVLCGHIGACDALAPDVFKPSERPWITVGDGSLEDIHKVIKACPSGALSIAVDGEELHHEYLANQDESITVIKNGPYLVKNVELAAEFNGERASEKKYILCRCGLSKNKPFCDGTHYEDKWDDQESS